MVITRRQITTSDLTVSQKAVVNDAISGSSELGTGLDEEQCAYLAALTAYDLKIHIETLPNKIPRFFGEPDLGSLRIEGLAFLPLFAVLCSRVPDAETYFGCLATLHKRRLKYQRILEVQPVPNLSQVGPRGLLQFGALGSHALVGWLFWRKWIFDVDNRAGQETGYIFEPIVARCVGGKPCAASKSPVKRGGDAGKGRQVDCLYGDRAYEIKVRVTVAASGQGRWGEEKDYPADCQASGLIPVLVVFDDTQADKLDELIAIFRAHGGEVYVGEDAWDHLEQLAGSAMSVFLERYVRVPLRDLLANAPARDDLPELRLRLNGSELKIDIGDETLKINRPLREGTETVASDDPIAEDVG